MGLSNLFKKKPQVQIVEKPVEKIVETPMPSRFTFAHNKDLKVSKYTICIEDNHIPYCQLSENEKFICGRVNDKDLGNNLYPVFVMPETLPKTTVITPKKVICIGTFCVDKNTNQIVSTTPKFNGMSLDDLVNKGLLEEYSYSDGTGFKTYQTKYASIVSGTIVDGDIDLGTFESCIIAEHGVLTLTY